MRKALILAAGLLVVPGARAQAPPTLEATRKAMGIPSVGTMRGQQDVVGFASTAAQMAKIWDLAGAPPAPEALGACPSKLVRVPTSRPICSRSVAFATAGSGYRLSRMVVLACVSPSERRVIGG